MKTIRPFWIEAFIFFVVTASNAFSDHRLLILGIDGCRPDALLKTDAPNLRALADSGLYSWWALSRPPTKSGPCWSSIFTGAWNDNHGVTDNTFANSKFDQYPMLFKRLKDVFPTFDSGWFVYWPDLATAMPHNAGVSSGNWSDQATTNAAIEQLRNGDPDALFVQLGVIDAAGHSSGFDPDESEYLNAIHEVDARVGEVLAAMKARPAYLEEDWMVIALSDHGGYSTHHGGTMIEEMRTFFIVAGNGVPQGEIPHEWIRETHAVPSYGLRLDGTSDYVSIPDRPDYHFGSEQNFTVELCLQTNGWSGTPVLFGNKNMGNDRDPGFAIVLIDEGKWRINLADGTNRKNISGPVIADDHWHHLTAVFQRTGKLTLFQDGIKTGAIDISGIGNIDTPYGLAIGQDGTLNLSAFVPANLNEIRVWKTALPDSTVRDWIFTPVTESHPFYSDLAGYWKMDDGEGTVIADASPTSNHAAFHGSNPQWIQPEAFVETLDFDSSKSIKTVDLTVTALAHFGIDIKPEWNLDGRNLVPEEIPDAIEEAQRMPTSVELLENYPNPFNGETVIRFSIEQQGRTILKVRDVSGREAACLVDGFLSRGIHHMTFSGDHLPSGVYILDLRTKSGRLTKKMMLMK